MTPTYSTCETEVSPSSMALPSASPISTGDSLLTPELFVHHGPYFEKAEGLSAPPVRFWKDVWRRFRENGFAMFGLYLLSLLLLLAMVGPYINGLNYFETILDYSNQPPSAKYWFGTDDLGRDIFTRIWYGARISIFVGVAAAFIDFVVGVIWGSIAAFAGGIIDEMMMRIADVLYALPYLLVVILIMVVMGSGLIPILIAMTIVGWITMARIVRGQILQLKQQDYVVAAQALGASNRRIIFKHLVPNAIGPIMVTMTLTIPSAIFVEAFLSFMGLGIQAPMASWGTMASEGLPAFQYFPWRLIFPGIFISLTMLAFNLIGEGLRDSLDPRLRS